MNRNRSIFKVLLVLLLFLVAAALILYPFIANYVFEHRNDSFVNTVEKLETKVTDKNKERILENVRKYNQAISSGHIQLRDPFVEDLEDRDIEKYQELLSIGEDGVMGIVEIPVIDVKLPIYHGTSKSVLEKGIGHLEGSSLPVGGEGTHSVLTGHTGLSNAKLFTDLIEMKKGDIFFVNILGDKIAYKVEQIKTVLPSDLSDLYVENGKDYCTLITCTPYGVNTHRLLVRGKRTDYREIINDPETFQIRTVKSKWLSEYRRALFISSVSFFVCLLILVVARYQTKKRY